METSIQFQEPVSVVGVFRPQRPTPKTSTTPALFPQKMLWKGEQYIFSQIAYHHAQRQGRTLMHIFHVTDGKKDFRLRFDTEQLQWFLEEVYDPIA